MAQNAPFPIDLGGVFPNEAHLPVLVARSQATSALAFLLLDTGYSKACALETSDGIAQFAAGNQDAVVSCGPTTALQPFPNALTYGVLPASANVQLSQVQMARGMSLAVRQDYLDGVSASYLLGARQPANNPQYPNRLVAFWSLAGPRTTITSSQQQQKAISDRLGHPLTLYTAPVTLLPAGDPGIPVVAQNELRIGVILINHVPIVPAQLPDGSPVNAVWDTGASYTVVHRDIAQAYNLNYKTGARIVLPELRLYRAQPPVTLRNLPAIVDNDYDSIVLGSTVPDRFRTVVLDFGTGVVEQMGAVYVQGNIRLLP